MTPAKNLKLSDEKWESMILLVSLPPSARGELEGILTIAATFLSVDRTLPPPRLTKEKLLDLFRQAKTLERALRTVILGEGDTLMAMIGPQEEPEVARQDKIKQSGPIRRGSQPRLLAFRRLVKHRQNVIELKRWIANAKAGISYGRTGNKTGALHDLTRSLDVFFCKHTGNGFTRTESPNDGRNDFLQECLALVGSDVTADAMIRRIKTRKGKVSAKNSS
jgi:hypothetical protein